MVNAEQILAALAAYEAEHEFARQIIPPVEERTGADLWPNATGYRWFKSPNIFDLEKYRRLKRRGQL